MTFCTLIFAVAELSFPQINSVYANIKSLSNEEANNKYIMQNLLDENSVLVLGSSEFAERTPYSPSNFFKNSALKIYTIGEGWTESIVHMLRLAPIVNQLKSKKLVLNISMQWISNQDLPGEALLDKVNKDVVLQFLVNTDVPYAIRQRIAEYITRRRVHFRLDNIYKHVFDQILADYQQGKKLEALPALVQIKLNILLLENNITQYVEALKLVTYRQLKKLFTTECNCKPSFPLTAENAFSYQRMVSNNPYLIEKEYYETLVRPRIDELRTLRYEPINSPEYLDIRDFVQMTGNADVLFVLSPVHESLFQGLGNQLILQDARELTQKLQSEFKAYDQELFIFDQPYKQGTLKNVTDLGAVGFLELNNKIIQKWLPEKQ